MTAEIMFTDRDEQRPPVGRGPRRRGGEGGGEGPEGGGGAVAQRPAKGPQLPLGRTGMRCAQVAPAATGSRHPDEVAA